MSRLGDMLRKEVSVTPVQPVVAEAPVRIFGQPVGWSADLERVLALPRRPVPAADPAPLTDELRRSGGTMSLRPIQAAALAEARAKGGFFGPIGVGAGKTLVTLLLPTALEAKVTVLLVPANLRAKLSDLEYPTLSKHWRLPHLVGSLVYYPGTTGMLHVVSYTQLSTANSADVLERLTPDLIVCDEGHSLKAFSSARTKRFLRYFKAHPATRLCVLSGTMTTRSIRDYAHLCRLSLKDGAPVPKAFPVLEEWASALDPGQFNAPPGELLRLCRPGEDVRSGYRRRLVETPGVVATQENEIGTSLTVSERTVQTPAVVAQTLTKLRETWCTPGGEEITDALSFSRYARQLAAGLYYRWIWPREEPLEVRREWLDARRDWHREVRAYLTTSSRAGLDSPLLYARAVTAGRVESGSYQRWADVRESAQPETEAVWVSDFLAQDAAEWGRESPGIVWVEHESLGRCISELGGFPFYAGGERASEQIIREDGTRTIVASVRAHGEGKNLQAFTRNLVTTPSSNGKVWEQLLGRTHRQGQTADEVTVEVYRHTLEMRDALRSAASNARYIQDTFGAQQKLCYLTFTFDHTEGTST